MADKKNEQQAELSGTLPLAQDMRRKAEEAKKQIEEEEREARRQEAIAQAQELIQTDVLPFIEEEATQGRFLATVEIGKTKGLLDVVNEMARILSEAGYETSVVPKYAGTRSANEATDYKGATLCVKW